MTDVIGFDLDSTICNTEQRQWMVPKIKAGEASWADYSMASADDVPVDGVVRLLLALHDHYLIFIMSGRSEKARQISEHWLEKHGIPYDRLLLKPEGEDTENGLLKVQWIKQLEAEGFHFRLYVEDWPATADVIRGGAHIPVLVVNPCYEAELAAAKAIRTGNV